MKKIFEHTSASWVKYSDYEWRTTEDGKEYLLPTKDAMPKPYDPMKDADNLVLAAADIGLMLFHKDSEKSIKALRFADAAQEAVLQPRLFQALFGIGAPHSVQHDALIIPQESS